MAGDHFAYVVGRGDREYLVLDGTEGPPFYAIDLITLVAGGWCAYVGEREGMYTPVICGVAQPAWPTVRGSFTGSRGAKHVAYIVTREGRDHVVLDGDVGPGYSDVFDLWLGDDGDHVAYSVRQGNREFVVADGRPGQPYDAVYGLTMARATGAIWYAGRRGRAIGAIAGGREQPTYDAMQEGSLVVTDDGHHWRYVAERAGKWHMVVNGHEGAGYTEVLAREAALSSDGSHFAYVAGHPGQVRLVSDDVEGALYDHVGSVTYSPDGQHLAYVAVRRDGRSVVVLDGREGPAYDGVLPDTLALGPDARIAYGIERDGRAVMVADGREGEPYDWVYKASLGAQGRYAYVALDRWRYRAVVDGAAGPPYDGIKGSAAFSEDGQHVYYLAQSDGERFAVLDGEEGRHFRDIVMDSPRFTDKGTFEYLAFADDGLYRVTHTLAAPEPDPAQATTQAPKS